MNWTIFTRTGLVGLLLCSMAQAPAADPLARARRAYNEHQFDAAIAAAREARELPNLANPAAVVLGRAHLERFLAKSDKTDVSDLDAARKALADVKPALLTPADRTEFLVGMGVSVYIDGCADGCLSAAAEFFDLALAAGGPTDAVSRETIFEWWAVALDRQAQFGPDEGRVPTYRRILERAELERARDIDSASATYWIAAASRGVGDFNRAWGAAVAGWVRAKYLGPRGETLRADLHRLVYEILLPERAKQLVPDADPRPQLEALRKQWTEVTEKYR
jgi:hypothetical protein